MHKYPLIAVCLLIIAPALVLAQEYFVQSRQAPLWDSPSFQAQQLALVPQGDAVQILEEKNGWLLVNYQKQTGWMLQLMLGSTPPASRTASDQQAMQMLDERARRRPSAFASTAAARGLMDKEGSFGAKLKLDYDALVKMESWRVTDQQALDFIAEGKKFEKAH